MSTAVMIVAGLGFVVSFTAHVAAWLRFPLAAEFPMLPVHAGIVVVWLRAALLQARASKPVTLGKRPSLDLTGCPRWLLWSVAAVVCYGFVNFLSLVAVPRVKIGSGTGIDPISELRIYSGHWMIFYAVGFAALYAQGLQQRS